MMALQAVIFDMDGTLVDSMPHHMLAWQFFLEKKGIKATMAEIKEKGHGTLYDIMPRFFGKDTSPELSYTLAMEKEAIFRKMYGPHMKPITGLLDWLAILKQNGVKIGLGTAADDSNTFFTLENLHIKSYFDAIVTSNQVAIGKPSPDVYLYASNLLEVIPANCLVFEDTVSGVMAAKAAGMKVAAITTMHTAQDWKEYGVDFVFADYSQIEVKEVVKIF